MRPPISAEDAVVYTREFYGLRVSATALPSESDRNFKLEAEDGRLLVLKISDAADSGTGLMEAQNQVLDHLNRELPGLGIPGVIPDSAGRQMVPVARGTSLYGLRLLSYVEGIPVAEYRPHSEALLEAIGGWLGSLDRALIDFDHPALHRRFPWDLRAAESTFQERLAEVTEESRRRFAQSLFENSWSRVSRAADRLPGSVIHGDANDYNLLVLNAGVDSPPGWADRLGLIDFGDLNYSWRIAELAISCAYLLMDKADIRATLGGPVRGYHRELALSELEMSLLYDLIVLRLLVSVAIGSRNARLHPENEYLQISQNSAWELLARLGATEASLFHYWVRASCGLEPHPDRLAVSHWILEHGGSIAPVTEHNLAEVPVAVVDLSVGSSLVARAGCPPRMQVLEELIGEVLVDSGAVLGMGRFDEPRLLYSTESYKSDDPTEDRTIHLGQDLFLPAGSPVLAPLDGEVHSLRDNQSELDYGSTLILRHQLQAGSSQLEIYTLYGHLSRGSLSQWREGMRVSAGDQIGELGGPGENGGWPPHLHFQLILDMLAMEGDFPGVCRPSERDVWQSVSPDPGPFLGIREAPAWGRDQEASESLRRRKELLGPSLRLAYRKPLKIARGIGQFLFDHQGRSYLDCVNNVAHVGHCHPAVVRAAHRQDLLLNTNTRYLHDTILEYAERLTSTLPEPLRVCFFVSSGSEANELALRLARAHTSHQDFLVLEGAYHGNTSGLIDISPYKFNGPRGSGCPNHVHVAPAPDDYRGPFKRDGERVGFEYARLLSGPIEQARSHGGLAAFICEPLLGCGGQIVPPPGYLREAFQGVRGGGGVCIVDEVQTGFGRVGSEFWPFELQDVVPDIVTMGKPIGNGHPLAAVVTTPGIAASFANGMEYFNTFGGNPVSCAVGLAVLDVVAREGLQQHSLQVGRHLKSRLAEFVDQFSLIGDVRGEGLFLGIELVLDRSTLEPAPLQTSYVVERMKEYGILVSSDGPCHNVIKIKPPLVFDLRDADRLVETLGEVLGETPLKG